VRIPVYRVFGGNAKQNGRSWTIEDPRKMSDWRDRLAVYPAWNDGTKVVQGSINVNDMTYGRRLWNAVWLATLATFAGLAEMVWIGHTLSTVWQPRGVFVLMRRSRLLPISKKTVHCLGRASSDYSVARQPVSSSPIADVLRQLRCARDQADRAGRASTWSNVPVRPIDVPAV